MGKTDILKLSVRTYLKAQAVEQHKARLREFPRYHYHAPDRRYQGGTSRHGPRCRPNDELYRASTMDGQMKQLASDLNRGHLSCNDKLDEIFTTLEQTNSRAIASGSRLTSSEYASSQALHNAAKAGDMQAMQRLLHDQRTLVNGLDPVGRTALHYCTNGSIAKMLIDWYARVNEQDFKGQTPLHTAVVDVHLEVVKVLLSRRADTSIKDYSGQTPLEHSKERPAVTFMLRNGPEVEAKDRTFLNNTGIFHVAWLGDQEGVDFYLAQGAIVDYRNLKKETCLAESARHGDVDIVRRLLKAGADIEAKQFDDSRPLLRAVTANRKEMVRELLLLGADPEVRNKQQQHTAIAEAAFGRHREVARILADFGVNLAARDCEGCTPLHRALQGSAPNLVQTLLARGAEDNVQCNPGRTPLYEAASRSQADQIETLLKAGAITSIPIHGGETPLTVACAQGHIRVVELLLASGADPSRPVDSSRFGPFSWTPLAHAARHGHADIVEMLLDNGADPNLRKYDRSTPLHLATKAPTSASQMVEVLLNADADVEAQDTNRMTPLALACRWCKDPAEISLLLNRGADIESLSYDPDRNNGEKNFTPLMRTVLKGQAVPATIDVLAKHGANLNARTSFGRTALHLALQGGRADLVDALLNIGAEVNVADMIGSTPLLEAARRGLVEQAKRLVARSASLTHRDHHGVSPEIAAKLDAPDAPFGNLLKPPRV